MADCVGVDGSTWPQGVEGDFIFELGGESFHHHADSKFGHGIAEMSLQEDLSLEVDWWHHEQHVRVWRLLQVWDT